MFWLSIGECQDGADIRRTEVEHLTHHETVKALCTVRGHVADVHVVDLWRKFPGYKRIAEIRLWCTRCGERERVELDAAKALGNDHAV